ncbi:hypothetical protein J6590_050636 [Homalodisca vitripennis]|nr:hypothetical protein J6590_050636 [Homalodisca vitripennis]
MLSLYKENHTITAWLSSVRDGHVTVVGEVVTRCNIWESCSVKLCSNLSELPP